MLSWTSTVVCRMGGGEKISTFQLGEVVNRGCTKGDIAYLRLKSDVKPEI